MDWRNGMLSESDARPAALGQMCKLAGLPKSGHPGFGNTIRLPFSVTDHRSHREIARSIVALPTTACEIRCRAKLAGLTYPLSAGLSEEEVEALLYPQSAP